MDNPNRQRAYGAGRTSELALIEDKLLFILVYFPLYPTQAVQGYLFGLDVRAFSHIMNFVFDMPVQLRIRSANSSTVSFRELR